MRCPACHYESTATANFCEECGSPMTRPCAGCGAGLKATAKFCPACGRRADDALPGSDAPAETPAPAAYTPRHLADKILATRSALEGERKQVTVLFSDIQGSMALSEQVDPEEWHRIMDRFFAIMNDGIHRFEGTINQYTGDGIMALFGAPIAHEDHAQRACFAALTLQDELRKYATQLRVERGLPIMVRIGLNSGEVVVGRIGDDLRMDYTALGHTVGLAARMQQVAEPGKTYLTGTTATLVRGYFALESLGQSTVKGASEPVDVFALEGVGEMRTRLDVSRGRGFSRFVGRAREMEALESALVEIENAGQVVGVVAEAGTGKSRLCYEFLARCRERGTTVYETHCIVHGRAMPLFPVLQLYRGIFGIADDDSPERARDKIAGRIVLIDEKLIDTLPLVFDFLGVPDPKRPVPASDPEERTRRILEILRRFTIARAGREPVVVLVDDLHWIDPGSVVFLESLVEVVPVGRLLLLVNFRPEYSGTWMQKSYYRQIPLAPLGGREIDELLDHLLGPDPSLGELRIKVRERTGGNPFFVEEVVRELVAQGHLDGARGSYRAVTPVARVPVPATVQGVLAARIDRLGDEAKRVLQAASAIGRTFSQTLLASLLETAAETAPAALEAVLSTLVDDEFVYPEALYPEPEYAFRHALTRDVAYDSLLGERKRHLHGALAHALEARVGQAAGAHAALIAHHYEEAGEDLPAAHWHEVAAQWSGGANILDCYEHWQKARTLLARLAPTPAILTRRVRASCQELLRGLRADASVDPAVLIAEARQAAAGCDDPHAECRVLTTEGGIAYLNGDFHRAFPLLDEAVVRARRSGDARLLGEMLPYWFVVQSFRDPAVARTLLQEIGEPDVEGFSETMGFRANGWRLCWRAVMATFTGHHAEAVAAEDVAIAVARAGDDRLDLSLTLAIVGSMRALRGDEAASLEANREAARIAETIGVRLTIANVRSCLLLTSRVAGAPVPPDELAAAVAQLDEVAYGFQRPSLAVGHAQLAVARGDLRAGLDLIRKAREVVEQSGLVVLLPLVLVNEASILLSLEGAAARPAIEALLSEARVALDRVAAAPILPRVHEVAADLEAAAGNDAGAAREREQARALRAAMAAATGT